MEPLIYSNETVRAHSLYPACRSWLNVVSDRDYPGKNYFDIRIECLDMDLYEKDIQHKAQADHTVDTVIGIQTYKDNRATSGRLLLVEFRMGYESTNNLSKTEMERKAIYTKALLGGEIMINQQSIFIFNDAFAPLAKNWFNRQQKTGGDFKGTNIKTSLTTKNLLQRYWKKTLVLYSIKEKIFTISAFIRMLYRFLTASLFLEVIRVQTPLLRRMRRRFRIVRIGFWFRLENNVIGRLHITLLQKADNLLERRLPTVGLELAFPNDHRVPTHFRQLRTHSLIPLLIASQLLFPPIGTGTRRTEFRATLMTMPKTTIDENCGLILA